MAIERRTEQLVGRQLVLELPESFENRRVEVIVSTLDEEPRTGRRPHPPLAGKIKIHGGIFDSLPEVSPTGRVTVRAGPSPRDGSAESDTGSGSDQKPA